MSGFRVLPGVGSGSIQVEVLIAIGHQPMRPPEIREIVSMELGREIDTGSIHRALGRALATGCAVVTDQGYREPFDVLSMMDGVGDDAAGDEVMA